MIYQLDETLPQVGPDSWAAPNAAVIGDVSLGRGSSVWFSATLRGDCARLTIGADSNIQDGAVLHADPGRPLTIGERVTVGHQAMLHGCEIADEVLIGIGAVVLNGARIGSSSLVGAGALVLEGAEFPAGSVILGAPAVRTRAIRPAEIETIRASAAHYRQNALRFAGGLRAIIDRQVADVAPAEDGKEEKL